MSPPCAVQSGKLTLLFYMQLVRVSDTCGTGTGSLLRDVYLPDALGILRQIMISFLDFSEKP